MGTLDQATLFWPLICERLDKCFRIIGNDYSQAVFATGWANRTPVAEFSQLTPADADSILVKGEKGGAIKKL